MKRLLPLIAFLLAIPLIIPLQGYGQSISGVEGFIIFKDGFNIHGKIVQQKHFEIDPVNKVVYSVPSPTGFTFLDDNVRRIYFPPGQIAETVRLKPGELDKDAILFTRLPVVPKMSAKLLEWSFESTPPFDKDWERTVRVKTNQGGFPLRQRIIVLTPKRMTVQGLSHAWDMNFLTTELDFNELTKLVNDYLDTKKEYSKLEKEDKEYILARFYHQMDKFDESEAICKKLLVALAESKEKKEPVERLLTNIESSRGRKFSSEFEPLAAAKQHRTLQDRLAVYDKDGYSAKVSEKIKLLAQELKNRYADDDVKLAKVRGLIKYLMGKNPQPRGFWLEGGETILSELNYDTLDRLETFITFAEQYKRDIEAGKTPNLKLENVFALAINGWHLGNVSAEPDIELAKNLWKTRKFLPEYMRLGTPAQREALAQSWEKEVNLPIDVLARVMQHLPPPSAYNKIDGSLLKLDIDLPNGAVGSYHVQLPPDYNHQRAHPVLVLLSSPREPVKTLIERFQPLAAQHGFILMAPLWEKFSTKGYRYSDSEQEYQMNCLRDLKRRFQVDTDRVFLFGWSEGGAVAWDTGLAHPDQYAGMASMCGLLGEIGASYRTNAQNMGLYIVDGEKSGNGPVLTRGVFKDFIRYNYNGYYLEYKGRANELYVGEFEPMMDWMSRKKRVYPTKSLGNYTTSGVNGEEFKTFRQSDNRFYWLQTDEIREDFKQDYFNWVKHRHPATLTGSISVLNEAGAKGDARIINLISLRTTGIKQVSVYLSPAMIDFSKPVQVRINSQVHGKLSTMVEPRISQMLEEYFENVDRQRLYYRKLDFKL